MTDDILQLSFSSFLAFWRSGDYNYLGNLIAWVIIFLFIGFVLYFTYKN